jgi:hypothetical protein
LAEGCCGRSAPQANANKPAARAAPTPNHMPCWAFAFPTFMQARLAKKKNALSSSPAKIHKFFPDISRWKQNP